MPSVSKAQRRTMAAAAHSKEFADKVNIPQSVARDFFRADQRKARRATIRNAMDRVRSR